MPAKSETDADAIAAFLAKRGATKIAAGQSALGPMSDKDWARAVKDTATIQARKENDLIQERHLVYINGVEHCRNGLGEWIY